MSSKKPLKQMRLLGERKDRPAAQLGAALQSEE